MSDWKVDPKEIDRYITRDEEPSKSLTWDALVNSGDLEGYDTDYYNDIDFEVATESPCDECGGKCRYEGRKNDRGSYRAFSVCETCGNVVEF